MIKKYAEYINEEYNFPSSLDPISKYLFSFLKDKFDWWMSRNSLANYTEEFNFDKFDLEDLYTDDFPIKNLSLKLSIKKVNIKSGAEGVAMKVKDKNIRLSGLSKVEYGKLRANMGVELIVNQLKQDYQYVIDNLMEVIRHELLHLYQGYKHFKNNKKYKTEPIVLGNIIGNILDIVNDDNLFALFRIYYIFSNKFEIDALAAQNIKSSDILYKNMITIMRTDPLEYCTNEKELNKIFLIFKTNVESLHKLLGIDHSRINENELKYLMKITRKDSKYFVTEIVKFLKNRIPNLLKKINKGFV